MTLKGVHNNVDFACAGLPDAAPSGILAGPLAGIRLQKLHKQQHTLRSHSIKEATTCSATAPKPSQFSAVRTRPVLHGVATDHSEQAVPGAKSNHWSNRPGQS